MSIVIATTIIKIYGYLQDICNYAGLSETWADNLWQELLSNKSLYDEFIYYLENHTFKDELKVKGYGLTELYIYQLNKVNIINEIGKNTAECNKEKMVMEAFYHMSQMINNPDEYIKKLESGWGNDRL